MNMRGVTKRLLSNFMWLFWGLFFLPLKLAGIIRLEYDQSDFKGHRGPFIIASNHPSTLDPLTIGIAIFPLLTWKFLPLTPYAAPLARLQRRGQRIAKAIGFLPAVYFVFNVSCIPETGSLEEKIEPLVRAVQRKQTALIFPQGRSSKDDEIKSFKKGVAELYRQTQAPVLPCVVRYNKEKWIGRIIVTFGAPHHIPEKLYETEGLEGVAEYIRQKVASVYSKNH